MSSSPVTPKYLFKLKSGPGQTLAIILAESEELAWAWAQGAGLPVHSIEMPNPYLAPGVTVLVKAEQLDRDMLDRLDKRYMRGTEYILRD